MDRIREPTVAMGMAFADDRTWPAMTGTISKPWYANMTVRPARSQETSEVPSVEGAGEPRKARKTASRARRGRSLRTVNVVQTRAEMEIPEATTRARMVTRAVAERRNASGLVRPREGAVAFVRPTITAEAERNALT